MPTWDTTRWRSLGVNSAGDPVYARSLSGVRARDYNSLTKDELVSELENRGLAKSGNKDDLIARLQENDR